MDYHEAHTYVSKLATDSKKQILVKSNNYNAAELTMVNGVLMETLDRNLMFSCLTIHILIAEAFDGISDCSDESDELICSKMHSFICASGFHCLHCHPINRTCGKGYHQC